jgi:hypothetical protein
MIRRMWSMLIGLRKRSPKTSWGWAGLQPKRICEVLDAMSELVRATETAFRKDNFMDTMITQTDYKRLLRLERLMYRVMMTIGKRSKVHSLEYVLSREVESFLINSALGELMEAFEGETDESK